MHSVGAGTKVPAGSSQDERNMMEFLGIAGIPGRINILVGRNCVDHSHSRIYKMNDNLVMVVII